MSGIFTMAPSAFPTPWAARAFAIVSAAAEAGLFDLKDFQRSLIASIGAKEAAGGCIRDEVAYYDCWIESLTALVRERGGEPMRLAVIEASIRDGLTTRHGHHHAIHHGHVHHGHQATDGHAHDHSLGHPSRAGDTHPHAHEDHGHGAVSVPRPIYVEQAR